MREIHISKRSFTHNVPSSGSLENSVFSSETRLVMLTSEPNPRLLPISAWTNCHYVHKNNSKFNMPWNFSNYMKSHWTRVRGNPDSQCHASLGPLLEKTAVWQGVWRFQGKVCTSIGLTGRQKSPKPQELQSSSPCSPENKYLHY